MKMTIRRFIIFISTFSILLCSIVIPTYASSYDGTVVDFLPAANYEFRQSTQSWQSISYPGGNSGNYSNVSLKWDNSFNSIRVKTIFINVRSSAEISTLRLSEDDESTPPQATYLGMYDSLYQFKIDLLDYTYSKFYLRIFFGNVTNVDFLVESCYGIVQEAIPFLSANHNVYFVYDDHNTSGQGTKPSQMWVEGGRITFPYTMNFTREVYPITGFDWSYQENIIELYPASQNLKDIGKVSILIFSNDLHAATVSLNVGGVTDVIPCSVERMMTAQKWPSFNSDFYYWQMSWYQITFDVSNFDLSGTNSCLYIYFEGQPDYYDSGYMYTYNQIVGAWYYPVSTPTPWYQVMWNWISGGFDRVVSALETLAGDPTGGAMQDAADQMQQQASDMNAVNDAMSSISRPEIDTGQLIGQSLDFSPSSLSVLSTLTNNSIVTPMLTLVCTFALVGYIFFGKK